MRRITSRQNQVVALYRDAARGEAPDVLLLDGAHLISEALHAGIRLHHVMLASGARDHLEITAILDRLDPHIVDIAEASPTVMDAVSPVRSTSPIVALASRPPQQRSLFDGAAPLVLVACDVQDPGNIGAIIRVAEGAGASGFMAAGQCADPFGWKAMRGSMGSALRLPLAIPPRVDDAVHEARRHHARVVATVPRDGVSMFEAPLDGAIALLIGGEGIGLPDHVIAEADLRVTIPMQPPVESLNAAVAAAVLLYEARRQRSAGALARR
jgi:TrmH family RNA methyltransferase